MEAINEGMKNRGINLKTVGVTEIRHFLYKNKKNTQLLCSEITTPYNTLGEFEFNDGIFKLFITFYCSQISLKDSRLFTMISTTESTAILDR